MGKEAKTNAMRILERAKVAYTAHEYPHEEGVAVDGVTVAASIGEDPACVYKTLVTQGNSKNYFVFVIPVAAELDLKAAARSVGEKSVAMIHVADINKVTGYVRGGCSPVGMKKQYTTVFAEPAEGLRFRRAHRYAGLLRSCRPHQSRTGDYGKDHLLKASPKGRAFKRIFIIKRFSDKSYLKRKTVSKLHKIFESFLTAGNTRENLSERSLQRRFFAVYCSQTADGRAHELFFSRRRTAWTTRFAEDEQNAK